jgi:ADP-ribosylglycohydrolase
MIGAHCEARKASTFGWGKGSTKAIQDIIDGIRHGHTPPKKVPGVGLGNGVMMKIAPLALYHALDIEKYDRGINSSWWKNFGHHVRMLGAITHNDPRAWIAAFATGMMIVFAARGHCQSEESRTACVLEIARYVEQFEDFCVANPHDRVLAELMRQVAFPHHNADYVLEKYGSKFTVIETLPFTIATFMRHPLDFRAGVLEAINAGGDTDTNASIVGAMIGANVGAENIPLEWRSFRPEYREAITLGDQLIDL